MHKWICSGIASPSFADPGPDWVRQWRGNEGGSQITLLTFLPSRLCSMSKNSRRRRLWCHNVKAPDTIHTVPHMLVGILAGLSNTAWKSSGYSSFLQSKDIQVGLPVTLNHPGMNVCSYICQPCDRLANYLGCNLPLVQWQRLWQLCATLNRESD